ncbi:MAG: hypothetical protein ABH863_01330 [Candidatus Micrarchaeota archaeon]
MNKKPQKPVGFGNEKHGSVILGGSRAIKHHFLLDPEMALKIDYAHRIAKEALRGLDIEVLQFRRVSAEPKPKQRNLVNPKSLRDGNVLRFPGTIALVSNRVAMDQNSRTYFGGFYQAQKQGCTFRIDQNPAPVFGKPFEYLNRVSRMHYERIPASLISEIRSRLHDAGMHYVDTSPHNIVVTPQGKRVLFEVLVDMEGSIEREGQLQRLTPEIARGVERIKNEYFQKLEELKGRREEI